MLLNPSWQLCSMCLAARQAFQQAVVRWTSLRSSIVTFLISLLNMGNLYTCETASLQNANMTNVMLHSGVWHVINDSLHLHCRTICQGLQSLSNRTSGSADSWPMRYIHPSSGVNLDALAMSGTVICKSMCCADSTEEAVRAWGQTNHDCHQPGISTTISHFAMLA